ncbi:hypothetical protein PQ465_08560 [Sphingobacterium oryzagri]|uniref:Ankyrin repeat domain-containing protein n=1 Tax=Sphingobacterium oryzagri TaxID=3025669 RepID=A0ABY7WLG1_9SPHI|nr:hypothetical protein [Sphingobacterium sp. KACC 22765]WDF70414.1 hypothetical protein PQ465_08560 [Sphingobacterium sp. KACC 22765]
MKIVAQDYIIQSILDGIESNVYAQGIKDRCIITYELNIDKPYIEFLVKDGCTVNAKDWFWLGYYLSK